MLHRFRSGLLVAVVVSILAAGCGNGSKPTTSASDRSRSQSASPEPEPVGAAATPEAPGFEIRRVGGAPPPASAPGDSSVGQPGERAGTVQEPATAANKGSAKAAAAAAEDTRPTTPREGRYTFHQTGSRRVRAADPQPFDETGTMDVTISGDQATHRSRTSQSTGEVVYRLAAGGIYLLRAKTDSSFVNEDETFDPPQLVLQWPVRVGDAWSGSYRSSDGLTSGTYSFTVLREETIGVIGRQLRTFVIENQTTATGNVSGESRGTAWYSPDLGLHVKRITDADGRYRGVPASVHTEWTLTGAP